jgi:hypothetical protein
LQGISKPHSAAVGLGLEWDRKKKKAQESDGKCIVICCQQEARLTFQESNASSL